MKGDVEMLMLLFQLFDEDFFKNERLGSQS